MNEPAETASEISFARSGTRFIAECGDLKDPVDIQQSDD